MENKKISKKDSEILNYTENKAKELNKLKQLENNSSLLNPLKKEVLLNQIKQLEEIKKQYNKEKYGITKRTNVSLNNILRDIERNLDQKMIGRDLRKSLLLLKQEKERKEDTLVHRMTYRDFIEKHIDFIGIKESFYDGETVGINTFLNYFTIEYINFLDDNPIIKATHKNLSKLKQLNIGKEDLILIINKTIKKIIENDINLNYNKILINIGTKKLTIDLNKIKKEIIKEKTLKEINDIIHNSNLIDLKNIIKAINGESFNSKEGINILRKINYLKSIGINLKEDIINKIKEKINTKTISLLERYLKIKDIKNRGDINDFSFLRKMMFDYYENKISIEEFKDILVKGYYYGFKQELKSLEGEKGLRNIKKYQPKWQEIFKKEVGSVLNNPNNAKDLFLLSWVESNAYPNKKSEVEAQGRFQILLSTANKIDNNIYFIEDLHKPILSAKISAKYLKQIIITIKKENPNKNFSDKKLLEIAITRYNGNWSTRLKENFKKKNNNDNIKIIYSVFKELNFIKSMKNKRNLEMMIKKLKETHNDSFKQHPNYKNGETNFGILDKINKGVKVNKNDIINWIDSYTSTILKQQLMYPYQLEAIKRLYNE